jgi:hypothetical protein
MRFRVAFGIGLAVVTITSLGCDSVPSPLTPSGTSPFTTNFNGLYTGVMTLTNVAGGECVGVDLSRSTGSQDAGTLTITQVDRDLTAVVRSASSGLQCTYTGKAAFATFAADFQSCSATEILFACTSGQVRILTLVGSTITATIAGAGTQGVVATSYNVYEQRDDRRVPVGGLVTEQQFNLARR